MDKVNKLIDLLLAIASYSKDLHYNAKGEAFYSKHLLADRIQENISEYIDQIKEVFFLAGNREPLPSGEYLSRATSLIPRITDEDRINFLSMQKLIADTLLHIEQLDTLTKGEENLVGAIAQDLQNSLGLINLQVKD